MDVAILNQQKDLPIFKRQVRALVNHVVLFEGKSYDEVVIHFVSKRRISLLHKHYFDDPSVTDCMSFPIDTHGHHSKSDYLMMGDVFVCPAVAIDYSAKQNKNAYEELSLYVVHGLLHLMGYDDMNSKDKKQMRGAEARHMKALKQQQLLLKNSP